MPALRPSASRRRRRAALPRAVPVPLHADPGLQPERTVMSWGRTVLALTVCALMLVRWYPEVGAAAFAPAMVASGVGAWIMQGQRRRYRRQAEGITAEAVAPAWRTVAVLSVLVAGTALLGMAALVVAPR